MIATARAHSNIALIKYWGKRDATLNLPAVGSISLTLDALVTETTVEFNRDFSGDTLILNDEPAQEAQQKRVSHFLHLLRKRLDIDVYARVISHNNFPTAAGLASSASGFAALTHAGVAAAGKSLPRRTLSEIARRGSGSAARSLFGGFVEMEKGTEPGGSDAVAHQLFDEGYWDVRLMVLVMKDARKEVSSTAGMMQTTKTSPYYSTWVESGQADLRAMRDALQEKDFARMGELAEFSCLKMHASAMAARPGILYWQPATLRAIHTIREIRNAGIPVYFTIDAGPQVKALCLPEDVDTLQPQLSEIPGVDRVIVCKPGPGASLVEGKS